MISYIGKRVLTGIVALFVLSAVTFFLTYSIPGSPFQNQNVSEDVLEMLEEEYGLNEPIGVQYGQYLKNLLSGDLGYSYQDPAQSVVSTIQRSFPFTVKLGFAALLTALFVGMLFGICQTFAKKSWIRGIVFLGTMFGTAIPNFVAALLLLLFFGVKLKLFPVAGLTSWESGVLPVIALSMYPASVIARLTKNRLEEIKTQEYIVLAKGKGLSPSLIFFRHYLVHLWVPILNYLGSAATFLLTGSFVVESIFNIPGLGRLFVSSIANRDYTLIMGLTMFMGFVVVVVQLLVDLLCGWIDPRIRKSYLKV